MRTYYLYYEENATINYLYLLLFYRVATIDNKSRLYNTILYNNLDELAEKMNTEYKKINLSCEKDVISKSTLSRVLNSDTEQHYFVYDSKNKKITLQNNFSTNSSNRTLRFITLNDRELHFLLTHNEPLMYSYYFYIKYYCGYSGKNYTDFTANQFLIAANYSTKAGNLKTMLSTYNALLVEARFISISKFKFDGKERNGYSIL